MYFYGFFQTDVLTFSSRLNGLKGYNKKILSLQTWMPAVQKRGILDQFKFTLVALCRFDSFWCVSSQFGSDFGIFCYFGLFWVPLACFWLDLGAVWIFFWPFLVSYNLILGYVASFWLVLACFESF